MGRHCGEVVRKGNQDSVLARQRSKPFIPVVAGTAVKSDRNGRIAWGSYTLSAMDVVPQISLSLFY